MEKVESDSFKRLIKEMYTGFPNGQVRERVEKVVVTENMRNQLIETKFLLKERYGVEGKQYDYYMLGPSSLALLSSWETEELTKSIKNLTWIVVVMAVISLILLFIQTLRIFGVI